MFSPFDFITMQHALVLAERGLYTTTPNPRVGCVLTQGETIIGEGFTQPAGQDHAEVQALKDARAKGHSTAGATAYVTLEPCSHFGRTPPCVNALLEAKIAKVVVAMQDPNPLVAGQGLQRLRDAGVEVRCGLLEHEARELNIGFVSRMTRGQPWVRMKVAASLDGKTALLNGQSQWITGSAARDDGHAWRARSCAILTGIGTVLTDDPQLNVRAFATPRQPLRVVVDAKLEIPLTAKILRDGDTVVVCAHTDTPALAEKKHQLFAQGVEVLCLPNAHGKVDLPALLKTLGARGMNELHVEAGYKLNGSFLREGCVDELLVYFAPTLLGDAHGMFNLGPLASLDKQTRLHFHAVDQIGADLRILARFNNDTESTAG